MENQTAEVASDATPSRESPEDTKKTLPKRTAHFIKNRVVNYIKNLDPRGKDKFWWTGNVLSATATASLFVFAPAVRPIKTLASVGLSVGLYAGEQAMERYRNKHWTEERIAERAAKRAEKFPNGTSRLKRFLLGVAAGGVYGAAFGIPLEEIAKSHPAVVKNIERHVDIAKKKAYELAA